MNTTMKKNEFWAYTWNVLDDGTLEVFPTLSEAVDYCTKSAIAFFVKVGEEYKTEGRSYSFRYTISTPTKSRKQKLIMGFEA